MYFFNTYTFQFQMGRRIPLWQAMAEDISTLIVFHYDRSHCQHILSAIICLAISNKLYFFILILAREFILDSTWVFQYFILIQYILF
jgi:hypothetical protein